MRELLRLKDISAGYNGKLALEDVNLTVSEGDFVGVIGPNGGGKTTLLKNFVKELNKKGEYYALYCSLEMFRDIPEKEKVIPSLINRLMNAIQISHYGFPGIPHSGKLILFFMIAGPMTTEFFSSTLSSSCRRRVRVLFPVPGSPETTMAHGLFLAPSRAPRPTIQWAWDRRCSRARTCPGTDSWRAVIPSTFPRTAAR